MGRNRAREQRRARDGRLEAARRPRVLRGSPRREHDDRDDGRRDPRARPRRGRPHPRGDGSDQAAGRLRRHAAGVLRLAARQSAVPVSEHRRRPRGLSASVARFLRRHAKRGCRSTSACCRRPGSSSNASRRSASNPVQAQHYSGHARRLAAGHLLRAPDRHDLDAEGRDGERRVPRRHSRPPHADLDRAGAHGRADVPHADRATRRISKVGASTPSGSRRRWARYRGSVLRLRAARRGDLARDPARRRHGPALERLDRGASGRSTSSPTARRPRGRCAPRFAATSSCRAKRRRTRSAC